MSTRDELPVEELLKDPIAVHLNMLRGGIAKLTPAQVGHLYRGDEARAVIAEVIRQNPEAADALQAQGWQGIETAPKDGTEVLIWNDEGHEIASWADHEDDGSDQPGHDEGWIGTFAFPGRSWGNSMQWEAQGQPTHWMPLPPPPTLGDPG